jgi:VIT1/CCC1 family predicted Fe2+/Mn2+ transporter
MADGLTVPFALAAGLSGGLAGAANATHIVVTAGLAEIAAGSISMGLGGYLAGKSDVEHYASERRREEREVVEKIQAEVDETTEILESFGLDADASGAAVARLRERPKAWVDFMMRFELGLEDPAPRRALTSAVTIAGAYVVGGLIPLAPYMAVSTARAAVPLSVVVTLAALAVFGYIKGRFTGTRPVRSAWQTALIGGIAAAAAFAIAKYIM